MSAQRMTTQPAASQPAASQPGASQPGATQPAATQPIDTLGARMEPHRALLFGLCYRMTGSAADAEDLVQDTFRRALERPPADLGAPLRPWLVRVATNLSIDALRQRRARRYHGPWLPSPIPVEEVCDGITPSPEAQLGLVESVTTAFLLALEALDPRQRAALVLRDVLGLDGAEVAAALHTTPGNVRVILHRARRTLEGKARGAPSEAEKARTAEVLRRLVVALGTGDVRAVIDVLAEDVVTVHDAGGEFVAAVRPLRGMADVARFYDNLSRLTPPIEMAREVELNGLPALVVRFGARPSRYAERLTIAVQLNARGEIAAIHSVLASRKLTAVRFDDRP